MSELPEIKSRLTGGKLIGSNIDQETYRRQKVKRGDPEFVMSRGELVEFNRCPHRWLMGYESEETKASEWGSLVDCLALRPDEVENIYAVTPEHYVNDKGETKPWNWNANACKAWRDEHEDFLPVKAETFQQAENAVKFLFGDPQITQLLKDSEKQVMAIAEWRDNDTDIIVPLKILVDLVPGGKYCESLADLKTASSANPGGWPREVFKHGYHVQAALYLDVYNAATGEIRLDFMHVLQESMPPWEIGKRLLSAEFITLGRLTYQAALSRYARCLAENQWPGYDVDGRNILNGWRLTEPEPWMVLADADNTPNRPITAFTPNLNDVPTP